VLPESLSPIISFRRYRQDNEYNTAKFKSFLVTFHLELSSKPKAKTLKTYFSSHVTFILSSQAKLGNPYAVQARCWSCDCIPLHDVLCQSLSSLCLTHVTLIPFLQAR
jgi:hypothetical protein